MRTMSSELEEGAVAAARQLAADADRVIVKAGTNSLTDDADSNLDDEKLDKLVDDLEDLLSRDKEVILVSSGAIGAGTGRVGASTGTVEESQALSTVGQSHLMHRYTESFARYDRKVAQLPLTQHDLENPERFTNLRNTIETLLERGASFRSSTRTTRSRPRRSGSVTTTCSRRRRRSGSMLTCSSP